MDAKVNHTGYADRDIYLYSVLGANGTSREGGYLFTLTNNLSRGGAAEDVPTAGIRCKEGNDATTILYVCTCSTAFFTTITRESPMQGAHCQYRIQ